MVGDDVFVCTAFVPPTKTRPEGYLAFEVDQDGLPLPEATGVQPVRVVDLRQKSDNKEADTVAALPLRPLKAQRSEHHFRLGGASPSVGVCYPEAQRFESLQAMSRGKLAEIRDMAEPFGAPLGLDRIADVVSGLVWRDRVDVNSLQNPRRLAQYTSKGAVEAFYLGRLTSGPLANDGVEWAVIDPGVWSRLETPGLPNTETFLERWRFVNNQGYHAAIKGMMADVVSALVLPAAQEAVADISGAKELH